MIARMRYKAGTCLALGIMLVLGCSTPEGGPEVNRHKSPLSELPDPDSPDILETEPEDILPATHMAAGRLHESQGRFVRAVQQYQLAIATKPDYIEAYDRLGIVLGCLARFDAAEKAFRQGIERSPDQAHLYNNLAFNFIMQKRWAEAEIELTRALELHDSFARARVNLGMVLAQQDAFEEALYQFRLVLPLADAYYNVGLMYQSKRQPIEAARAFMKAVELNPKMAAAGKRLEELPVEVLSAAQERGSLDLHTAQPASPSPVEPASEQASAPSERPSTQPARAEPEETVEKAEAAEPVQVDEPNQVDEPAESTEPEVSKSAEAVEPTEPVALESTPPTEAVESTPHPVDGDQPATEIECSSTQPAQAPKPARAEPEETVEKAEAAEPVQVDEPNQVDEPMESIDAVENERVELTEAAQPVENAEAVVVEPAEPIGVITEPEAELVELMTTIQIEPVKPTVSDNPGPNAKPSANPASQNEAVKAGKLNKKRIVPEHLHLSIETIPETDWLETGWFEDEDSFFVLGDPSSVLTDPGWPEPDTSVGEPSIAYWLRPARLKTALFEKAQQGVAMLDSLTLRMQELLTWPLPSSPFVSQISSPPPAPPLAATATQDRSLLSATSETPSVP